MEIINQALKFGARTFLTVEKLNNSEIEAFRMNTCRACEQFDSEDLTCGVCGCFMDVKTTLKTNKTFVRSGVKVGMRIEETHCPLGKWNDKETANYYRELDGKELLQ